MNSVYDFYMASAVRISGMTKRRLLAAFGSTKAIFDAGEESLKELSFLNENAMETLISARDEARLYEGVSQMEERGISLVTWQQPEYPALLKNIYDAPFALFYKGTLPAQDERSVAVVGSRRCSGYGQVMARDLSSAICKAGFSVVSGMALGIDGYAHEGALIAGGRTYAVLGCGVDICYPASNRGLYEGIIQNGAVISEYPPGTNPLPSNFPQRNRIISGLSKAVLVIEAREKSGSLITADLALEQGRDVYALPGRITDGLSCGCNRLIAQGAGIIRSKESLISDLIEGEGISRIIMPEKEEAEILLEKEEKKVYSCFDFYAKSIDSVQEETGMDLLLLLSVIMSLCKKGLIKETFKNEYIRLG